MMAGAIECDDDCCDVSDADHNDEERGQVMLTLIQISVTRTTTKSEPSPGSIL